MPDDPSNIIDEATRLMSHYDGLLGFAYDSVLGIPARREEATKVLAAARARQRRASEELKRVRRDDLGEWHEAVAEEAYEDASAEVRGASAEVRGITQYLGGPDFDAEYRKAVARQIAGLLREDYMQRLDDIAARSDAPELRRTVAEYKDEVSTSSDRLIRRFREARTLLLAEVRQARAEAQQFLGHNGTPPP